MTFRERVDKLRDAVYGGLHNAPRKIHDETRMVWWTDSGDLATFDGERLTRLVIAAHDLCLRVSIENGGPRCLSVRVWPRERTGKRWQRHPRLEEVLAELMPCREIWDGTPPSAEAEAAKGGK